MSSGGKDRGRIRSSSRTRASQVSSRYRAQISKLDLVPVAEDVGRGGAAGIKKGERMPKRDGLRM